jgi:bifunctional DNase/RNase
LVLAEAGGKRRLPIIIGGFEAQAIAIELEKMVPTRPLTHDLFKSFAQSFEINVKEVIIYKLIEGIFYAKILCEKDGHLSEIDARTSDAVAIGVRFSCPIFTFENILSSAGILLEDEGNDEDPLEVMNFDEEDDDEPKEGMKSMDLDELENELNSAIEKEDYELASKIRDEINKRTS